MSTKTKAKTTTVPKEKSKTTAVVSSSKHGHGGHSKAVPQKTHTTKSGHHHKAEAVVPSRKHGVEKGKEKGKGKSKPKSKGKHGSATHHAKRTLSLIDIAANSPAAKISRAGIRRIGDIGGVMAMQPDVVWMVRREIGALIERITEGSANIASCCGRKTISLGDVQHFLKLDGRPIYGICSSPKQRTPQVPTEAEADGEVDAEPDAEVADE